MRRTLIALTLAAVVIPTAPAFADPPPWAPAHGRRDHDYDGRRYDGEYGRDGRYYEPRRVESDQRVWRGQDGRTYCKRSNGTTGLLVGGAAGALLGRSLDGGEHRTTGTVLGAAGGALVGREIDRGGSRCR